MVCVWNGFAGHAKQSDCDGVPAGLYAIHRHVYPALEPMQATKPAATRRTSGGASSAGKTHVVRGVIQGLLKRRWSGGDRLTEAEASDFFEVSRTPVREALVELASLGIVELRRNCGAVFLPFGEKELRDLYAVRSLLEVEAARLAAGRMPGGEARRLRQEFEKLKRERRSDAGWHLDRELHAAIAQAADNPRLAGEIARYGDLVQTTREAVGGTLADIHSTSVNEHLRILRALESRKPDRAAEAMRLHLQQAADSAAKALRNLQAGVRR
jgi:DNA-binding GntR family transcriptional regulator